MLSTMKDEKINAAEELIGDIVNATRTPVVYVIQEIAGTRDGRPKINILGAAEYGTLRFLLPELSQIIFSPGPLIFKLRKFNQF